MSDRGTLGWCSVSLISCNGKRILFDTGSYSDRSLLLEKLALLGLKTANIDLIFLSHFHYDHVINTEIFTESQIIISEREYRYIMTEEYKSVSDPFVPISFISALKKRFVLVSEGTRIVEGLRVIMLPGHTPGSMGLLVEDEGILFAGDAVKNAFEFREKRAPSSFLSEGEAIESYEKIAAYAQIVIPGHDLPFSIASSTEINYLTKRTPVRLRIYSQPEGSGKTIELFEE